MLSFFQTFIWKFITSLWGVLPWSGKGDCKIKISVELDNEIDEMTENCEDKSFQGSDGISDSFEEESFEEAYASHLERNLKKKQLCNDKTMYINYDIKIIGNTGNVNIGPSASEPTQLKTDLMKFALVSYKQGVQMDTISSNMNQASFPNLYRNYVPNFTKEEGAFIKSLVESHNHAYKSKSVGEDFMENIKGILLHNQPLTTNNAHFGYKVTVERMVEVAKSVEEFRELTEEEQSVLLAENMDMLVSLRSVIFFSTTYTGLEQIKLTSGYDDEKRMTHFLAELSEDDINHLNIGDVLEYKQFNRLQNLSNNNLEKEYENLQGDIGQLVESGVISVLLTIIILFMSDFKKEKTIMDKYVQILSCYISARTSITMGMVKDTILYLKKLQVLKRRRRRNSNGQ